MQWEHLAMELQNKIRWAISTSYAENGGIALPFREAVNLARAASGELVTILKQREDAVGILDIRSAVNGQPESQKNGNGSSPGSSGFDPAAWARGH